MDSPNYLAINQLAVSFLVVAAFFQCLDALQVIATGALRGFKDAVIPMFLIIGSFWVIGVGSAYYLAFHTSLGAMGVWYGVTFGICTAGLMLILRLRQRLKRETSNAFV